MIKIKEIDPKFAQADAETKGQLFLLAIQEAFKEAATSQDLALVGNKLAGIEAAVRRLENRTEAHSRQLIADSSVIEQKADKNHTHEQPKSQLEVKVEPKKEEPKEVPSASLLENIIKLFRK